MPALARKTRRKKHKVSSKSLTEAQKKKFVKTFREMKLQISDLEKIARTVSFFHI